MVESNREFERIKGPRGKKRKRDFNEEIKTKSGIKKKKKTKRESFLAFETVQLFDGGGCG